MGLTDALREQLGPTEFTRLREVTAYLLEHGWIWRDDPPPARTFYHLLARYEDYVRDYIGLLGFRLERNDRLSIFHIYHEEGAHRRPLPPRTAEWLLLARLVYAEQMEDGGTRLTAYPTITVGQLYQRMALLRPGVRQRQVKIYDDALRALRHLKLIRAASGRAIRARQTDQIIELLPALEVVVPAARIDELLAKLQASAEAQGEPDPGEADGEAEPAAEAAEPED